MKYCIVFILLLSSILCYSQPNAAVTIACEGTSSRSIVSSNGQTIATCACGGAEAKYVKPGPYGISNWPIVDGEWAEARVIRGRNCVQEEAVFSNNLRVVFNLKPGDILRITIRKVKSA